MNIFVIIPVLSCVVYFTLGFGVTLLVALAKKRNKRMLEMLLWPAVLILYSIVGDID